MNDLDHHMDNIVLSWRSHSNILRMVGRQGSSGDWVSAGPSVIFVVVALRLDNLRIEISSVVREVCDEVTCPNPEAISGADRHQR